jgi:hypothetical protein
MNQKLAELLPNIYEDLAQPSIKRAGLALGNVVGIITTPLGTGASILEKNLDKFVKRLDKETDKEIIPINPEIGIPVFEKLRYTTTKELTDLYTELLLKASLQTSATSVHPSYLEIISNLSPEEAGVISAFQNQALFYIPFLTVKQSEMPDGGFIVLSEYFTSIEALTSERVQNLIRLGILERIEGRRLVNKSIYSPLKTKAEENWPNVKEGGHLDFDERVLRITEFGNKFIDVCVPKIEN